MALFYGNTHFSYLEHNFEQGSPEWLKFRSSFITPSNFKIVIDGTADAKNSYLDSLRFPAKPIPTTRAMQWGKHHEPEAFANYVLRYSNSFSSARACGFFSLPHPFLHVGGSPDVVIENSDGEIFAGAEIKCPYNPQIHLSYLNTGAPSAYFWQFQGYMWILNAEYWDFVSYDPRHADPDKKLFRQRFTRQPEVMDKIANAVSIFHDKYLRCEYFDKPVTAAAALLSGKLGDFLK